MRVAMVLLLAVGSCGMPDGDYFGRTPDTIDPRHFRWCNQGEPDYLDPALATSTISAPLITALYDAPTTYGPDGNPVPSLAMRWRDEDSQHFTFELRADARFSNGRRLDAYDVAYSALRVAHPLTASPNSDQLAALENFAGYLAQTVFVMRRDVGGLHTGDIVESVDTGDAATARRARVAIRTASMPLALRDLGAPASAAYATVPPGAEVTLVLQTGGRATWPSPDGAPWAYVHYALGRDGIFGWVPAAALDGQPGATELHHVRRVRTTDAAVAVTAADLLHSTDAVGIRVPDPTTLELHTVDPAPSLVAQTSNRAFRAVAIEAVSRAPRRWARNRAITSGPLHLVSWTDRDRVELVRSPTYWNQADIAIDRLTAFSIDDQAAATNFYYTGGCDAVATNNIPSTYLPALNGELRNGRAYKDYRVDPYLTVYFLWLQNEKLTDRHLRRALSLAIDRSQIPRFTHGGEIPTTQLTPGTPIAQLSDADLAACGVQRDRPGFALVMETGKLCYVPPPGLDYDPQRARQELALSTWKRTTLEYRYNAGAEAHKQIAEYLQAAWKAIGIDVVLVAQEWNSMLEDSRVGKFEILRLGSAGTLTDTETEFLALFRCGAPENRGRYCSQRFEQLMTEARSIHDRKLRNAKLAEAEAVILDDAPMIPIYVYTQKHLIKPYVKDYAINVIDQPALWRVRLEAPR